MRRPTTCTTGGPGGDGGQLIIPTVVACCSANSENGGGGIGEDCIGKGGCKGVQKRLHTASQFAGGRKCVGEERQALLVGGLHLCLNR